MILIIFVSFLVISTIVFFALNREKHFKQNLSFDALMLIRVTSMAIILGLVMGSLSLNSFKPSDDQLDLHTWTALKPTVFTLTFFAIFEIIYFKKWFKC
jgi:hypothetical protein